MVKKITKNLLMAYSLPDLIYNFPEIAHFKECRNFTYQISNQANLDVYNLHKEEDIVGKDVFYLKEEIMKNEWDENFANEIHASDISVVKNKKPLQLDYKIFLNKAGYVVVHSMMKLPVFNNRKKVEGILTLSFDSTKTEKIIKMKELYSGFYSKKMEANLKFMEHIGFEEGVKLKLSSREVDCLLCLMKYRSNKRASSFLNITLKTLDNHISKIREKTGGHYNIQDLLEILSSKISKI